MTIQVSATVESWPLAGTFRISRGAKSSAEVVVVSLEENGLLGVGECVPYARYGESPQATARLVNERFASGVADTDEIRAPTGCASADNALDCAAWDLQSRRAGRPVWELAGLPAPAPVVTAYTISLGTADEMGRAAAAQGSRQLLKLKLGGEDSGHDAERLSAVRSAAPGSTLIVDANEGWSFEHLERMLPVAHTLGIAMIEQPLPVDCDDALVGLDPPIPLGADESVHGQADLARLREKYQVVNVKLDKTGGLTRAVSLCAAAREIGFDVMIGCMVATSLSMAPALLLTHGAAYVDLDGPLLLREDRQPGLEYCDSLVSWPDPPFWGNRAVVSGRYSGE